MNIVFYSHTGYLGNGGAESLFAIVTAMSKNHNCTVITNKRGTLNEELDKLRIRNKSIPFKWSSGSNKEFKNKLYFIKPWVIDFLFNKRILKHHISFLTKEVKPDIIYTNTSVIDYGLLVSKKLKVPHVWHLREFQSLDYELLPNFGWRFFEKKLNKSQLVIVNSEALKLFYSEIIETSKLVVIHNGITCNKLELNTVTDTIFHFITVGTLIAYKGHRELILVCKILKDNGKVFKLNIVGGGQMAQELCDLVDELDLNDVITFWGPQRKVSKFYKTADCLIMNSNVEAFGRVTLEAMLHELSIIGKEDKYSATKEIVRNGIDGLLYTNRNELIESMSWMIKHKDESKIMGKRGYERALNNFSLEHSVSMIESNLQNLLKLNDYVKG